MVIAVSNMLIFFAFVQVLDFFLVGGLGVVRSRLISLFTNKKGFCKCVLIHKDIPPLVNPNIKKTIEPAKNCGALWKTFNFKIIKEEKHNKVVTQRCPCWLVGRVGWLVGWLVGRVGWLLGFLSG